jgi:serine/threonine-protein kinase
MSGDQRDEGREERAVETVATLDERDSGGKTAERLRASASGVMPPPVDPMADWKGLGALASGRYRVLRSLGQGGMGEVLLVADELVGREVAMKVVRSDRQGMRGRFLTEAKVQARLEHPVIVPLYDMGLGEDGNIFFTMKRIRGDSLREVLDRLADVDAPRDEQISQRRLLAAFSQVCLAVHYAHERGVVHRDLKPSNIMMGGYGEVYIIDWGVAKIVGVTDEDSLSEPDTLTPDDSSDATGTQDLLGTPGYVSPEQLDRGSSCADERSDVYSLGAILFEILSLNRLHGADRSAGRILSTLDGIDAAQRLADLGVDAPPELVVVCSTATAQDPTDRFSTARELSAAIDAYLEGDRNQELRRELAERYASSANQAFRELESDASESTHRTTALHDVGQALALDPENRSALRTLVSLLTSPPKEVPDQVRKQSLEARLRELRVAALLGLIMYLYVAANAPLTAWIGYGTSTAYWVAESFWLLAVGLCVAAYLRPSYYTLFGVLGAAVAACVAISSVFSPVIFVPGVLTVHAVVYSIMHGWRRRIAVIAIVVAGFALATFGEWFGLFADTVRFLPEGVLIVSSGPLKPTATKLFWLASALATAVLPALAAGVVRSRAGKHELAVRLQAWQLKQLVPEEAHESAAAT